MTEREKFEAWANGQQPGTLDLTPFEDTYDSDFTSRAWDAWQARALLAAGASEDARDAARYRWLRKEHFPTADNPPLAQVVWKKLDDRHRSQWVNMIDGNDLDRAIDAAIAKEQGNG